MTISKSAADKPKSVAKAKNVAKTKPAAAGDAVPMKIKPAAVLVPAVSVVGTVAEKIDDSTTPRMLKKQALVDRVVTASGAKKKDVKQILDAALAVLGDALSAGEELNLPPLGKAKVNRQKVEGGSEVLIIKLRRGRGTGADTGAKEGLAEDGEDD